MVDRGDDELPRGVVIAGRTLTAPRRIDVDAVVIGTGAGGSVTLRALARAGIDVLAIEEGSDHLARDMTQREDEMLPALFQDRAGRMTEDLAITVLQGRGVGGSTIHNTNLCKRTPPEILDLWARRHGVSGCSVRDMEPAFSTIERDLSVSKIDDAKINANNDALRRGVAALGWRGGVLSHNRVGCIGSGFCELGCAYDAKQNARKIMVPAALERGARVLSETRVERVLHDGRRALGVEATTDGGARLVVRARVVVLAGSAVGSAHLARVSRIPDASNTQGEWLRIHPGGVVAGEFDDDRDGNPVIDAWRGIPQSYECTEHLDLAEGSDRRVWITTAFAHPIGTASSLPGFGAGHMRAMRNYGRLAVLTAMVHDESKGSVVVGHDERPVVRYRLNDADRTQLVRGLQACARLLLAAGARRVTVPSTPPIVIRREADIAAIDLSITRPHALHLTAVHPMGTMHMGDDPRTAVVRSTGEHHHIRGLFVADGSLFPTSLGGPPQISIYSFAEHLSPHVVEAARR